MRPLITWLDRHFEFGLSFAGFIGAVCGVVYSARIGDYKAAFAFVAGAACLLRFCFVFDAPKVERPALEEGTEDLDS